MRVFLYLVISIGIVFLVGLEFLWLSPNYDIGTVKSGSMSPAINAGDLVITTNPQEEIKPGMIVTYNQDDEVIIHRVASIENGQLRTKGDVEGNPDQWLVPISGVRGVYLFKVPHLGHLASFIRAPFYQVSISIFFAALTVVYERKKKDKLRKGGEK